MENQDLTDIVHTEKTPLRYKVAGAVLGLTSAGCAYLGLTSIVNEEHVMAPITLFGFAAYSFLVALNCFDEKR